MIVASIDVETGDVVLIGLPRNLENVPFPEGTALAERYPAPYGFDNLLNEVYQTVVDEPALAINPYATDPGADTLKKVIGFAISLDIDYYALVDMQGFEDIIDAIGGIRVYLEEPLPYGQRGEYIDAGWQLLD
ncbi:LCP family protein, partial [Algoriphagus aestuarii]|nr:LCP family protein [Algoriphagus aestuarii]